uniref:PsbP-like protein 1 n=1 Tax=California macrophylla TaxID=337344 RepID=A0A0F7GYD1_9ROSI
MASLQNSPSLNRSLFLSSLPHPHSYLHVTPAFSCCTRRPSSFLVRAEQASATTASASVSPDRPGRRQLLAVGIILPSVPLLSQNLVSFAAENKKGFIPVLDKKDGYTFLYPFGWQEVTIEGQDKVFKDVIEPLESVSVNVIPTSKEDIREFGSPQEIGETLIKKVLAPPNQKTKLIEAKERDVDGKTYYTIEFIAQAPNYTRHALSTISIANGKFYTLTTGANERRWGKMKDKLQTVVESFTLSNV